MVKRAVVFLLLTTVIGSHILTAQTTAFNYQGSLTDGGNPANGAFQMQFKLFDTLAGGTQIGPTLNDVPVTATNGVFSAKLDFGSNALSGANRWLEIAVRHPSSEFYTTLSPREQIVSSPYAVRTLSALSADNALNLGGIPASEYVTNSTVGSSFIRNGTTLQTGNFNLSGNGFFGGRVGVGTSNPLGLLHLKSSPGTNAASAVEAPAGFFSQYQLYTGADNPWIIGTQDNFANGALLFRKSGTDVMAIRQTGNVGIGTNSPVGKLHIEGGGLTGLSLLTTGPVSIGGYVTQPRDRGGTVKAMVLVVAFGRISRCYNGLTGASETGIFSLTGCGFTMIGDGSDGSYTIDFGFQVSDRFMSATSRVLDQGTGENIAVRIVDFTGGFNSRVNVRGFYTDTRTGNAQSDFFLIVY